MFYLADFTVVLAQRSIPFCGLKWGKPYSLLPFYLDKH